jgi:hypothetical protein
VVVAVQPRAADLEAWDFAVAVVEVLDRYAKVLSACLGRSCDFRGPSVVRWLLDGCLGLVCHIQLGMPRLP